MEFGLFLSHQRIRRPECYSMSIYEEKRAEAELADSLGYDMVWVPEHHLIHFMQAPNALMLAQHVGRDLRIRVGTMATLLPLRHPLITAAEIAMTVGVLGDRFELGIGRGAYQYEFERLGVPFDETRARFDEIFGFLESLWKSPTGAAGLSGAHYDFPTAAPWPQLHGAAVPRVWVTAMTEPSIRGAASVGRDVATWPFIRPMAALEVLTTAFHEGREEAGARRGAQQLTVLRAGFVSESEAEIEERVEEALINHRINQRLHYFTQNADVSGVVEPEPLESEPTPAEVRENLLIGTPDEVLDKVRQYDALGVDQLMVQFDYGPDHEAVRRSMRLFASDVMAPFRAERSAAPASTGAAS